MGEGGHRYTRIKKICDFPVPSPARESLVSDITAGDGKMANLFLQCRIQDESN